MQTAQNTVHPFVQKARASQDWLPDQMRGKRPARRVIEPHDPYLVLDAVRHELHAPKLTLADLEESGYDKVSSGEKQEAIVSAVVSGATQELGGGR